MKYLIYIAGPYTADTAWKIERNCRRAEAATLDVWKSGHVPVTPHLLGRYFHGELNERVVLDGLLVLLRRCDGMLLLPGWKRSPGSLKEVRFCYDHGIIYDMGLKSLIQRLDEQETMVKL